MKKSPSLNIFGLIIAAMLLALTGCSDDKSASSSEAPAKTGKNNHIDYGEASDSIKSKFITAFAKKCVARELKNSINKDSDEKRFQDACDCIAKHIADDLAEVDAEKYLQEHEDTQTLEIKFDSAAYFCLQSKPQPKGPQILGKPQS